MTAGDEMSNEDVAQLFGVPPRSVGILYNALHSKIGENMKSFVEGLLCADTKDRFEAYAVALQWGWLSADDNRKLDNLGPNPGGDTYLTPLNMTPLGEESRDG